MAPLVSTNQPSDPTASVSTSVPPSHPATPSDAAQAHTALLQQLDLNSIPRPFRNPSWKPPQRRNKTVKQILADQARRDALALAASANASTNAANSGNGNADGDKTTTDGAEGAEGQGQKQNKAGKVDSSTVAATYKMSTLAIERRAAAAVAAANAAKGNIANGNEAAAAAAADGAGQTQGVPPASAGSSSGPIPTYTNIESAPSLHPASRRHYCDVTGLPAPYTDPKTRLRYHNGEVFGLVRTLGTQAAEGYLEARGAHTVLK